MTLFITKSKKINKILIVLLVSAFWLGVWEIISMLIAKEILMVSPIAVLRRLSQLIILKEFWVITLGSIFRILYGFVVGALVGVIFATITKQVKFLDILFYPIISVIKATPVASFIILTLIWLQTNTIPIFISFLMVLPIIWGNVGEGISNIDKSLGEMAKTFKIPLSIKIRKIYIPSVMPYFVVGCKISLGLAWKAGIAAEVLVRPPDSIGKELYNSRIYLETLDVFAWTVVVIILSVIIEKIFISTLKRFKSS